MPSTIRQYGHNPGCTLDDETCRYNLRVFFPFIERVL